MAQKWCRNGEAATGLPFLRLAKRSAGVPRKLSGLVDCSRLPRKSLGFSAGAGMRAKARLILLPPGDRRLRGNSVTNQLLREQVFAGFSGSLKRNNRAISRLGKADLGQCSPGLLRCYARTRSGY